MKYFASITGAFIIMLATLSSCQKDNNWSNKSVKEILEKGTWRISLYSDNGVDETYYFTDYNFTFSADGTVSANKGSNNITGTYAESEDDSRTELVLDFGTASPFNELNDDWHVIKKIKSEIGLEDVSGGGGGTDLLTFVKNQ